MRLFGWLEKLIEKFGPKVSGDPDKIQKEWDELKKRAEEKSITKKPN